MLTYCARFEKQISVPIMFGKFSYRHGQRIVPQKFELCQQWNRQSAIKYIYANQITHGYSHINSELCLITIPDVKSSWHKTNHTSVHNYTAYTVVLRPYFKHEWITRVQCNVTETTLALTDCPTGWYTQRQFIQTTEGTHTQLKLFSVGANGDSRVCDTEKKHIQAPLETFKGSMGSTWRHHETSTQECRWQWCWLKFKRCLSRTNHFEHDSDSPSHWTRCYRGRTCTDRTEYT